jgi:hypothetical protein
MSEVLPSVSPLMFISPPIPTEGGEEVQEQCRRVPRFVEVLSAFEAVKTSMLSLAGGHERTLGTGNLSVRRPLLLFAASLLHRDVQVFVDASSSVCLNLVQPPARELPSNILAEVANKDFSCWSCFDSLMSYDLCPYKEFESPYCNLTSELRPTPLLEAAYDLPVTKGGVSSNSFNPTEPRSVLDQDTLDAFLRLGGAVALATSAAGGHGWLRTAKLFSSLGLESFSCGLISAPVEVEAKPKPDESKEDVYGEGVASDHSWYSFLLQPSVVRFGTCCFVGLSLVVAARRGVFKVKMLPRLRFPQVAA